MTTVQLTDVQTLRDRARKNIQEGAVTEGYSADRQTVLRLLNEALATELVCFLRYKRHYFMATGLKASIAAAEFLEHANQEMQHADQLAERIMQLGGEPDFNPRGLEERSHAEYVEGKTLKDMVTENLIAERIAIDSYREIITYLGNDDPTSRRIFRKSWPRKKNMRTTWPTSSTTSPDSRARPVREPAPAAPAFLFTLFI